jgi:hypothetical protein
MASETKAQRGGPTTKKIETDSKLIELKINIPGKVFNFCRCFAEVNGKTVEEYVLLGLKDLVAAELVYSTELSDAEETASRLGICDFLHDPDLHTSFKFR